MDENDSNDGCPPIDQSSVDDLKRRASELGLEPKIAFMPKTEVLSKDEVRRLERNQKVRLKREKKKGEGYVQVNFSDIPVNQIDAVRAAVQAVLNGESAVQPKRGYLVSFGMVMLGFIIGSFVVLMI